MQTCRSPRGMHIDPARKPVPATALHVRPEARAVPLPAMASAVVDSVSGANPSLPGGVTCVDTTAQMGPVDRGREGASALTGDVGGQPNSRLDEDEDDRTLLHRISHAADRDAFRNLYVRYYGRLTRFLSRITRERSDVEEIINDALLVVWQHAGTFRGASRVSTWIFGIAYRCALKTLRRASARLRLSELALLHSEELVEDIARGTEERQLLEIALSSLPAEQRLVLVLAYCMGYSCEEIAEIAECPVNTVKTRMFYARRKLRMTIPAADK